MAHAKGHTQAGAQADPGMAATSAGHTATATPATTTATTATHAANATQVANARVLQQIGSQATRKLKAQRHGTPGVWLGLGLMGMVGWSVVVPTLAGAALGLWLDSRYPGGRSWTLALLMAGLTLGCINAWHWVTREDAAMHKDDHQEPRP